MEDPVAEREVRAVLEAVRIEGVERIGRTGSGGRCRGRDPVPPSDPLFADGGQPRYAQPVAVQILGQ